MWHLFEVVLYEDRPSMVQWNLSKECQNSKIVYGFFRSMCSVERRSIPIDHDLGTNHVSLCEHPQSQRDERETFCI